MRKTLNKGFKCLMVTGMIAGTLAAMLPFAPASAGTRAWSTSTIPSLTGNVLRNENITALVVSPNFATDTTIFAVVDGNADGIADRVAKSTNGGSTWSTPVDVNSADTVAVTAIAISPRFATDNTLVAADLTRVYRSTNGGSSWGQLGAAIGNSNSATEADADATDIRVGAVAIAPNYDGTGVIAAGLIDDDDADGTVPANGVLLWGLSGVLNWSAATSGGVLAADVTTVAFSPNYAADATILAVATTDAAGTQVHAVVGTTTAWNAGGAAGGPITIAAGIDSFDVTAAGAGLSNIMSSSLAVPSDFDSSNTSRRTVFVGVSTADTAPPVELGGVYRALAISGSPTANLLATAVDTTSLSLTGDHTANGTLFIGLATNVVRRSTNHFGTVANITTTANTTNPVPGSAVAGTATGAGAIVNTQVATASDFATTNTVFVGNSLAGAASDSQTGFSNSTDGGATFAQISLVDDESLVSATVFPANGFAAAGAGRISDIAVDGTIMYLSVVDDDTGANATDSLWRSTNSGTNWARVDTTDLGALGELGLIGMSPTYATDGLLYWADGGIATGSIRRTTNSGGSFAAVSAPLTAGTISALKVLDTNTLVVGSSAGAVRRSINRGFIWSAATASGAVGPIVSIARSPLYTTDTAVLVGDSGGQVYRSTNGGSSFTVLNSTTIGGASGLNVAFDGATPGVYYAASSVAGQGVYRWVDGTSTTSFTNIDAQAGNIYGAAAYAGGVVLSGPDGTLYAADNSATSDGIRRSVSSTARSGAQVDLSNTPLFTDMNNTSATAQNAAATALGPLAWVAGSNVVYAVRTDVTPDTLLAYTDTFSNPMIVPTLTSPVSDAQVGTVAAGAATVALGSITFTWPNVTGANGYQIQLSTVATFATTVAGETQLVAAASGDSTTVNTATGTLLANTRYFWRVRAYLDNTAAPGSVPTADLITRFSDPASFIAGAGAAGVAIPALTTPVLGNIGYVDQPAQPTFVWTAVTGATAYELQVGTDGTFTAPGATVIDRTGANRLGNQLAYQDAAAQLQPGSTYFWRVRAIVGSGTSAITGAYSPASAFRTAAGTVGQAGTPETVLATLQATGKLELVSSFNYTTSVYQAYVPNLPGNPLTSISPNSVLFITVTADTTVIVSGVEFKIKANTPTPVPVGAAVTVSVKA